MEDVKFLFSILALIGLCFVLGLVIKALSHEQNEKPISNQDYVFDILGNGLGGLCILFFIGLIIGFICLILGIIE